ncbi:uncharacterized protein LOC120255830 [Dioscorea cayenensis subsp. rotundata]|uniref:Uncharacterized protein LOC120255830 n=1 Tax=Dioscorea cayennensis subsp. rotundata TaxID=55577 RepID=A0AB40AWV0_DIOCR|nr:uncharacterized protein LOC120255830 [Dioscorea cayenensis subsp. rotundata]
MVRDQRQQQAAPPPPPPPPPTPPTSQKLKKKTIMEFKRSGPLLFEGTTNPDDVEVWVEEMEKAFAVMKCNEEEKLRFGVYMLEGPTKPSEYRGELRIRQGKEFESWEQLRKALFCKYFTRDKMVQFERKFINLTQGRRRDRSFDNKGDRILGNGGRSKSDVGQNKSQTVGEPPAQRSRGLPHASSRSGQKKCSTCGGVHDSKDCRRVTGACYRCGSLEHHIAECPQMQSSGAQRSSTVQNSRYVPAHKSQGSVGQRSGKEVVSEQPSSSTQQKAGRPKTQGRVYALTQEDTHASNAVVSGILSVYSTYACVLFDSGATHSFISSAFIRKHILHVTTFEYDLCVATLVGVDIVLSRACENCPIIVAGHELLARLHVMGMIDYDIIFGEWIFPSRFHLVVDCYAKRGSV